MIILKTSHGHHLELCQFYCVATNFQSALVVLLGLVKQLFLTNRLTEHNNLEFKKIYIFCDRKSKR